MKLLSRNPGGGRDAKVEVRLNVFRPASTTKSLQEYFRNEDDELWPDTRQRVNENLEI